MSQILSGPSISEFAPARDGRTRTGLCTQASAAMAFAAQNHPSMSQQDCIDLMFTMYDDMFARGQTIDGYGCAEDGAATLYAMAYELRHLGAHMLFEADYGTPPNPPNWEALIRQYAGTHPIVLQVASAHLLSDTAGIQEDSTVDYHAVYIAGQDGQGNVIVADPNNPTVMQRFDTYPLSGPSSVQAAQPCGLLILAGPPPATTTPRPGWIDTPATGILMGPPVEALGGQQFPVVRGFRQDLLADRTQIDALGAPLEHEQQVSDVGLDGVHGPGVRQLFERGGLCWTQKEGVFPLWTGLLLYRFLKEGKLP
jgi:hypothetical protein